ncbi:hypothetical protein [Streptomyces sp. NRRL S-1022]|uniref:hypothetical protein n=1 Tax=Streptomyces sp. NRRL S-1022 TaxID=1463880 RepID=UPI0005660247|nr:hypothetical protein [Streptomyces sp. NRRL S-1022]
MRRRLLAPALRTLPFLVPFLVALAAWAAWLGWDQQRDVHPDGSTSGPYEAWQVIGLVLTLLVPVCGAVSRGHVAGAITGTTAGLTAAAWYDWSDDSTGLFAIGVGLVVIGSLAGTAAVAGVMALAGRGVGRTAR